MSRIDEPEVLSAGAGPTGLTLACGLLANGVAARVVDKAVEPPGVPERALRVEQIVVHVNGNQAASVRVGQRTPLVTRPGLVISQPEVEAELRRRVSELGGQIVWGSEVTAAEQDSHGVTVSLDGEQSRVSWLVGCDGAHSRVRELAGIGFPGVPLEERFLLVDIHAVLTEVARLLRERTGCDPSSLGDSEWVTSFRAHRRLADTYRNARILLAGDAAHVPPPVRRSRDEHRVDATTCLGAGVPAESDISKRSAGRAGRKWFHGQGPLPGDRVPGIDCVRAEGGEHTTLHAELGDKWALVMPGQTASDEYAAVVAKRLGDDGTPRSWPSGLVTTA